MEFEEALIVLTELPLLPGSSFSKQFVKYKKGELFCVPEELIGFD